MSVRAPFVAVVLCMLVELAVLSACGRTPEARTAYPCVVDMAGDCAALEKERDNLENTYREEAQKPEPDAVRADDIGACSRAVVEQELALKCFASRCGTLCELHPCGVQNGGECADECEGVVEAAKISTDALEGAMARAAERPGFCTCQVCDAATDALCKDLWVCP